MDSTSQDSSPRHADTPVPEEVPSSPSGTISSEEREALRRQGVFLTSLNEIYNWGRANSIWPLQFGLACCAIEMIAVAASRFDIARFGAEIFRPSPRQADLLIVSGTVTKKMAPQVVRIWNQMAEPKYCMAMGACSISGGPFRKGYNVLCGIDRLIPVDVYVPGCPPRPEALLHGLIELQKKIKAEKLTGKESVPRHLRKNDEVTSEWPIPVFGAHDLILPKDKPKKMGTALETTQMNPESNNKAAQVFHPKHVDNDLPENRQGNVPAGLEK